MTDKYPLLTFENVKYRYWEHDPGYSTVDIAKVTGAPIITVRRFMLKNKIPIRDRSEANINRFKCKPKLEAHLGTVQSQEYRDSQSQKSLAFWRDNQRSKDARRKLQEKETLSEDQISILFLLHECGKMFMTNLIAILDKDNYVIEFMQHFL